MYWVSGVEDTDCEEQEAEEGLAVCADVDGVGAGGEFDECLGCRCCVHGLNISYLPRTLHWVIDIVMRGLRSLTNWRTFCTGVVVGYLVAWGVHRATYVWTWDLGWVEESVPWVTPSWSRP